MPLFKSIISYHRSPPLRITLHLLFWLLVYALRLYLTHITFNVYSGFPSGSLAALTFFNVAFIAGVYYMLVNVIWGKLAERKKYLKASFSLLLLILVYTVIDAYMEQRLLLSCSDCITSLKTDQPHYYTLISSHISNIVLIRFASLGTPFLLLLSLSVPLCIKLASNGYRNSINSLKLSEENLRLELNFLKGQLNPHFLFNSMNNIYGLIISGEKDKSAGLVSRLSALLRYMLYDSNASMMPLEKEVKLIRDYIELEKVRLNYTQVDFDYHIDDRYYEIAPLLMIPLIENAFKFNADKPTSVIQITLEVLNGNLSVSMSNAIDAQRQSKDAGGIGLKNLKKRLDLCYPGKYQYTASVKGDKYSVNITIQLA